MSATTQLLSSGEFCKLRYDTIPVKSASANVSFYTNNSKMPDFEFLHTCRKSMIRIIYKGKGKGKVIPLQAQCGPEGG